MHEDDYKLDKEFNDFLDFLSAMLKADNNKEKPVKAEKPKEEEKKEEKEKREEPVEKKVPSSREKVMTALIGLRKSVDSLEAAVDQYVDAPVKQKTARWIGPSVLFDSIHCSNCLYEDKHNEYYDYCPCCGALMTNHKGNWRWFANANSAVGNKL